MAALQRLRIGPTAESLHSNALSIAITVGKAPTDALLAAPPRRWPCLRAGAKGGVALERVQLVLPATIRSFRREEAP